VLSLGIQIVIIIRQSIIDLIGYQNPKSDKIWPYAITRILAAEFVMIIVFTSVGFIAGYSSSNVVYLLILIASISMGMQSAAAHGLGIQGVTTTYVTRTWTTFMIELVDLRRSRPSQRTIKEKQNTTLQAVALATHVIGAAAGGLAGSHFLFKAAILPAGITGVVLFIAWIRFRHTG
jgi:uncharacterized membrane protein YoaK (UPF0700 family)